MACPKKIILASSSPRRRELLKKFNIPFEVRPAHIEEEIHEGESPQKYVLRLAREKVWAVSSQLELDSETWVLGADTVVDLNGIVFEKPVSKHEAKTMIQKLSGNTHNVHTGIALFNTSLGIHCSIETTAVTFNTINQSVINAYIAGNEWKDKAGGYAIQGQATLIVERIDGCFYNVVGLPLRRLSHIFSNMGWSLSAQLECYNVE